MLKRQIVGRVTAAVIRVTRARASQQHLDGGAVCIKHFAAVLPKPPLRNGLDDAVHLDQVPRAVDLRQGQPMQLAGCGAEPLRRGEEFPHSGRMVDTGGVLQEEIGGDRLGGKEGAQVEQVLRVRGQERGGHRPGTGDVVRKIRISRLFAE